MTKRTTTLLLLSALSLLCAGALYAQDAYQGFPVERVRYRVTKNHVPDPLYQRNKIILQNVRLVPTGGGGMRIIGAVITDLDADRVPPGEDLPRGQLQGLKVRIELYQQETVLEHATDGTVQMPRFDPKNHGVLIQGQNQVVEIDSAFGPFGMTEFALPVMDKPLAPGAYKLVAGVYFGAQDVKIRKSVKWVSRLYGAETESIQVKDKDGNIQYKDIYHPVMDDDELHEKYYKELTEGIGKLEDETRVWIGSVKRNGKFELKSPAEGADRSPANYLLWGLHHNLVGQVIDFENQLDNVDENVDAALEEKLKVDGATDAMKEKWTAQAAEEKKRIKRDNPQLIEKYGGRVTSDEEKMHASAVAARAVILRQIADYQAYLTRKYWVLLDGVLLYRGWHSINVPGWNADKSIVDNDAKKLKKDRVDALKAMKDAPGGLDAKWEARREAWKYQPRALRSYAFDYFKTKQEEADWDPENFTREVNDKLVLDIGAWAKFRNEFMSEFLPLTEKLLQEVTTTGLYYNQTWPRALSEARRARDKVVALTYSWEYYIRTERMGESKESVIDGWREQANQMPEMNLQEYYKGAASSPGTVYSRFNGHVGIVKSKINLTTFAARYRSAVDAGAESGDLLGSRPPSAPEELVK